ncbi:MAG TPA: metallophosphoesterase family protein, partial [Candidatus Omnitrophota bacterium]|nr:metallophosphoesterase family protein [Candidatus Omnitrophota bacterium]
MNIAVVSDTHSLPLPQKLLNDLKDFALIIHAGDVCDAATLDALRTLAPVKAVQGNMDEPDLKRKLPLRELLVMDGVKVGVHHGHGPTRDALSNALAQFKDEACDVIIFGHSHQPLKQMSGKTLMFNPGSPNDTV